MQIRLGGLWEVEVDDDIDGLDIDTSRQEVGADEVSGETLLEVVEHSVSVGLLHLGMGVETRVPQFSDFACEELDAAGVVAEKDRLVDLELRCQWSLCEISRQGEKQRTYSGKQGVETVHLLALFDEAIELRDSFESEFVHQVDLGRLNHVRFLPISYSGIMA